jgi:hypothetical protein
MSRLNGRPAEPPPPASSDRLSANDRFRLREELGHCLDFVSGPIPSDPARRAEWCTEHGITEGYASAMGPRWAEAISRLAVLLHSRLGGWPEGRYRPDDLSAMVWELFELSVRICDAQDCLAQARMQCGPGAPVVAELARRPVADQMRVLEILGDVLRFTPAGFARFKEALRGVVESMLSDRPHLTVETESPHAHDPASMPTAGGDEVQSEPDSHDEKGLQLLGLLARKRGQRIKQADLVAEARMDPKTARPRLRRLVDLKYVDGPAPGRVGYAITEAGRRRYRELTEPDAG